MIKYLQRYGLTEQTSILLVTTQQSSLDPDVLLTLLHVENLEVTETNLRVSVCTTYVVPVEAAT